MANKYTNPWTKEEIGFLRDNYMTMGNLEIRKKLKKSKSSVNNKLIRLNLRRPKGLGCSLSFRGRKFSEKHKKNIGLSNKKPNPKVSKARKNLFKEGKINIFGKNNPNWKNGISFEPYPSEFNRKIKQQIKKRDNYICQAKDINSCKGDLVIHHIDYDKNNNTPQNLVTVCNKHNSFFNSNREHWKNYFKMIMFIKELFNPKNILMFNENKKLIGVNRI